jgi:radical SAM superfamily enzyme YgiQ (UPF0313 family)
MNHQNLAYQVHPKGKVLFLYPPVGFHLFDARVNWVVGYAERGLRIGRTAIPPLGLLYLASVLLNNGYEVEVVDFTVERYDGTKLQQLIVGKDAVGISVVNFAARDTVAKMISDIRLVDPDIPIIVGGPGCTLASKTINGADITVLGEAELTIVPLIERLLAGGNLSDIPGVIYRDRIAGIMHDGAPPIFPEDLDALPFPARQIVDARKYKLWFGAKGASMITSRGCPFHCTFCARAPCAGRKYRKRSVENVVEEIQLIYEMGYDFLAIVDSNFLLDTKHVHKIMDGILERDISLIMLVEGRVDTADEELYRKMRGAGVRVVFCGLESGNQDVLDFYEKGTTVEQNRYAVELADRCGLYVQGCFILGAPIETEQHLDRTVAFAKSLPLGSASFSVLTYVRGAPLWDEAFEQGRLQEDEHNVLASRERGLGQFEEAEIKERVSQAIRDFYFRHGFILAHFRKAVRRRDGPFMKLLLGWALAVLYDNLTDRLHRIITRLNFEGLR